MLGGAAGDHGISRDTFPVPSGLGCHGAAVSCPGEVWCQGVTLCHGIVTHAAV